MLGAFLPPFVNAALNVALPTIGRDLRMSVVAMSWAATIFLMVAAVGLVPGGRWADLYGRRRALILGLYLHVIAAVGIAFAPSAGVLIGWRAVQGVGGALIFATGIAVLSSVFARGHRGQALGWHVAAIYAGLALGPFLGGWVTSVWGWRVLFLLPLPIGAAAVWTLTRALPQDDPHERGGAGGTFDIPGAVLYVAAFLGVLVGLARLPTSLGWGLLAGGMVGLIGFGVHARRTSQPLVQWDVLARNRAFLLSNLVVLLAYTATFAVSFLLSVYLQIVYGLRPRDAGLVLVVQPVVQAIGSPFAGRWSDRWSPGHVASIGLVIVTIGLAVLTTLQADTPIGVVLLGMICVGAGFALFSAPNTHAIVRSVSVQDYGIATGILGTMRVLGQSLSMVTVTLVMALYMGGGPLNAEQIAPLLRALHRIFGWFVMISAAGVLVSHYRSMHGGTQRVR